MITYITRIIRHTSGLFTGKALAWKYSISAGKSPLSIEAKTYSLGSLDETADAFNEITKSKFLVAIG